MSLLTPYPLPLTPAYAAPCYGTHMPEVGRWDDLGGQTHIIQNRKLESPYGKVSSSQFFYQMSWGVFDWFSFDGKIGVGDVTYKAPDNTGKTTYPTSFAGGYGFRVKVYKNKSRDLDAVFGFQHISVHPGSKKVNDVTNEVILDDWQGSALVSKAIGRFTPYIGSRLSRLDLIHKINNTDRKRKKSDVDIGAVAGLDFELDKTSFINAEARFIEETSFNFGFIYHF